MRKYIKNKELTSINDINIASNLGNINTRIPGEVKSSERLFLWVTSRDTGRPALVRCESQDRKAPTIDPLSKLDAVKYLLEILKGRKAENIKDGTTQIDIASRLCRCYPDIAVFGWIDIVRMAIEGKHALAQDTKSSGQGPAKADSLRRFREKRLKAGAKAIGLMLTPEATRALDALVSSETYPSKAAAVSRALVNEEKRMRRRQNKDNKPN